jgi:hypothetical protein
VAEQPSIPTAYQRESAIVGNAVNALRVLLRADPTTMRDKKGSIMQGVVRQNGWTSSK